MQHDVDDSIVTSYELVGNNVIISKRAFSQV